MSQQPEQASPIGLIVATHGELARVLVETGAHILGRRTGLEAFRFREGEEPRAIYRRLQALVRKVDRGRGVIILADLFGGTPGSLALSMMDRDAVEVVTGVNLPMILAAAGLSPELGLEDAAGAIAAAGGEAIRQAGRLLEG